MISAGAPLCPGVLLTPDFPPNLGGIATYLFSVYSSFDLSELKVIAPSVRGDTTFDETQQYGVDRLTSRFNTPGIRSLEYCYRTYRHAKRLVKNNPELILHCGHILAGIVASLLKRKYGSRYCLWTHALEVMDKRLAPQIRSALLHADLIIANSDYTNAYLCSIGIPRSRIKRIHPCTDSQRFRPGLNADRLKQSLGLENRHILLTVGAVSRRYHYKGQDMVIRALPEITKVVPTALYVIAGAIKDRQYLLRLAKEYGVVEHVKILGPVTANELPTLYNAADIFIMCSREEETWSGTLAEGFGVAFLEASSCGKPVIGGRSGGVPDAVREGITGLLVDPRDPSAIALAITRLLAQPTLAGSLGLNGREWVEQQMNPARAAREFQAAMETFFS